MANVKISELPPTTTVDTADLMEVSLYDSVEQSYSSKSVSVSTLATRLITGLNYASDLETTSKTVSGAINEVNSKFKDITGTLTQGSTSLTLTDSAITTSATYDFFTSIYGVNPTSVSVTNGSPNGTMVLTFDEQESDMSVKVRIS